MSLHNIGYYFFCLGGTYFLKHRTRVLKWLFTLAAWRPDTASTSRIAAHMEEVLLLDADSALESARRNTTMFRVFNLLSYLYASMPNNAVEHIVRQYRFEVRGAQDCLDSTDGQVVAVMHTWDYWYGVMALMIRTRRGRTGIVVRLRPPDAYDIAVAQRMKRAGFSLIFVDGSVPAALRQIVRTLREGGLVFLFPDYYPTSARTMSVRWFGRSARLPSGLLAIAALANVPVTIAETHIDSAFQEWIQLSPLFMCAPVASAVVMQKMVTTLEQRIRAVPEQWRCWEYFETYFYQSVSLAQRELVRQISERKKQFA